MSGEVRARVCASASEYVCTCAYECARVRMSACVCESYSILHAAICYQVNTHTQCGP
jgi:hypothetical protein